MPVNRGRRIHDDAELRCAYAAALGFLHLKTRTSIEAPQSVDQRAGGRSRIEQSADCHVAADAGKGVEISDPHTLIIEAAGMRSRF